MVQFLSINFFFWIYSIFVGFFFKSSRFFCVIMCVAILVEQTFKADCVAKGCEHLLHYLGVMIADGRLPCWL